MDITVNLYDMIFLALSLLACYSCKCYGYQRGISDTIQFFEDQGVIKVEDAKTEND